MRKLASFGDPNIAQVVRGLLHAQDIACEVRADAAAQHAIWVLEESELARARDLLAAFTGGELGARASAAPPASGATGTASAPGQATPVAPAARPPGVDLRQALRRGARRTPLTFWLVIACVVVAFVTSLGDQRESVHALSMLNYRHAGEHAAWSWEAVRGLWQHGELWRLWTPILLHFGFFHLFFNALCVIDLGPPTERQLGSAGFALFVAWSAAVSNLAQLYLQGPNFGGMSGVAYAMVGYHWARQRFDPLAEPVLRRDSFIFFGVWLLLGFTGTLTGLVGAMANYCHLGGLLAGAAYGYVLSLRNVGRLRN